MLRLVYNEHPVYIVYNTPHESCVIAADDRGALFFRCVNVRNECCMHVRTVE